MLIKITNRLFHRNERSNAQHSHKPYRVLNVITSYILKTRAIPPLGIGLIILLIGGCLLWTPPALASLGARPAYLFLDLSKGNPSGTFTISNLGNEKQTYRARAIHFELKENGSILPVKPDDYSLAKWIKFNPKEFTLPPKSSRIVRFTIVRDGRKLKQREYWGAIEFTPLSGASFSSAADEKGRVMEFKVITALLIPIYGEMPGIVYGGRISDISAEQSKKTLQLSAMVENTGDGGLRTSGSWQIFAKGTGNLIKNIPVTPFLVLPKQRRHFTTNLEEHLPSGGYTVTLSLKYKDGKTLSGRGEVEIP